MSNLTLPVIPCATSAFTIPSIFGLSVLKLTATQVKNYTASSPPFYNPNHGETPPVTLDFCNVTITHTHPGQNDAIITQIYLPSKIWNGRLQSIGGGGYIAGLHDYMFVAMDAAIAEGYVTAATNAGLYTTDINGNDADTWALLSPGNVDLNALRNFASASLRDMTLLAKAIIQTYYGQKVKYSYWSGCSNGGRQGMVLAQMYPGLYDGIAACAPGLFWDEWVENYWGQLLMNERGHYPWPCEADALRKFMLDACDALDGANDGILQVPEECGFEARSVLGRKIECPDAGSEVKISETAVLIAEGVWQNRRPADINFQGNAAGYDADLKILGSTSCSNGVCVGDSDPLTLNLMRIFVKKDITWDPRTMTRKGFEDLRQQSVREYRSIIGISDYDLRGFKEAGGKMITYQGTGCGQSDPLVSYKNTLKFYNSVREQDPSVHDYYRVFLAPGLGHAVGGPGAYPNETFHALVEWVENGIAPEELRSTSAPDAVGKTINRVLCAYPKRAIYNGSGDVNDFRSWNCRE
ncbi:putative feruloyl esterase [Lojkania enalia]|uniref:Carboxylic ester hydrolase n=1 Tax=Lojkania enalia TaxID=147567 RepID=A0A9P4N260_9PLEO|nr:putative feruloyl esterase [Didymosphaeria enalia]